MNATHRQVITAGVVGALVGGLAGWWQALALGFTGGFIQYAHAKWTER